MKLKKGMKFQNRMLIFKANIKETNLITFKIINQIIYKNHLKFIIKIKIQKIIS